LTHWNIRVANLTVTSQNRARDFGSRLITAAALQGLAAGSLLAGGAEASSAHHSAEPGPPMHGIAAL